MSLINWEKIARSILEKKKKKKETSCDKLQPDREMEVDLDTFSFVDSPGRRKRLDL